MENFIKSEYRKIYPGNKYTYSKEIISGVKEVFKLSISSETVRKILKGEKMNLSVDAAQSDSSEKNYDSLDFLHGFNFLRKAKSHHTALRRLSEDANNIDSLFRLNAGFVDTNSEYAYYDPHSIKYTGMKNILKGWCGSAGKITKVNYQDFFHSSTG